ncbi:energy transducer TonB [Pseudomonas syringae group genomosp. 3]|nr:energy transducer TonB [Pseudomonas syringae group genomosp. 3]
MRRVPSVIVLAGLLWAGAAQALPSYPVPLFMPDIDYPENLRHPFVEGDVTVRIFIKSDGSVRFLELINSTDPRLIEVARLAVEQWRFAPWAPPASHPEGEIIKVTHHFRKTPREDVTVHENIALKRLTCVELNRELVMHEDAAWEGRMALEPTIFRRTEHYLNNGPLIQLFLSAEERQALVSELLEAVPGIVAQCRKNPVRKYVDYLPENVRNAL